MQIQRAQSPDDPPMEVVAVVVSESKREFDFID
jgi:hypothetical protein